MVVSEITSTVVGLDEMKSYLKLDDFLEDDALVQDLLKAAEEHIELICNRLIGRRSVTEKYTELGDFVLKYETDAATIKLNEIEVDGGIYDVVTVAGKTRVCLKDDEDWPDYTEKHDGIEIVYLSGYSEVPSPIKVLIRKLVNSWYDNRMNGKLQFPTELHHLLTRYIRW